MTKQITLLVTICVMIILISCDTQSGYEKAKKNCNEWKLEFLLVANSYSPGYDSEMIPSLFAEKCGLDNSRSPRLPW
ncbi:MAG: hypothetical protein H7A23_04525 [Leptospiraceae bacterium]|nr:hypothetical protein [Leptospiraceae bacterium]